MSCLKINKGLLLNNIIIPSSKSYANRALILAAIDSRPFTLENVPKASDVTILIECLEKIGLKIYKSENSIKILNSFPECEREDCYLQVGEGGTTARFLAALVLKGSQTYKIHLGQRLKERPWKSFLEQVVRFGGQARLEDDVLILKGPIQLPAQFDVDCSKTTQFATAFELISFGSSKVIPTGIESSKSYWEMTKKIIYEMSNNQTYQIPKDWSCASYPLAFGALNQKIYFPNLLTDFEQADSKFVEILKKYDAISEAPDGITVASGKTVGSLSYNVADALDLVPSLAFFLAHIDGEHTLTGIENLIYKESNRLEEVMHLLKRFNRKSSSDGKTLVIFGHNKIVTDPVDLFMVNDHRMVMAATLFLLHHSGGTIGPIEAVDKSYPEFFSLIN